MAENQATGNSLVTYLKESKEELKKVAWPSRDTVVRDTIVVLALSGAVAAFFGVLDFLLTYGFRQILQ